MSELPPPPSVRLILPWSTIGKILLTLVLVLAAIRLSKFAVLLLLALLVAITLTPLLHLLERWRLPRKAGILVCALLVFSVVALLVGLLVPAVSTQGGALLHGLPNFKNDLLQRLPKQAGVHDTVQRLFSSDFFTDPQPLVTGFMTWSTVALEGFFQFLLLLIISIYFLADGDRTYRWLVAFLPPAQREKVAEAAPEVVSVVGHYVGGQLIISGLCGVFTFATLTVFHVSNAIFLAVFAAFLDVLPLIGITISMCLAMALALMVSPFTAVWVGLLFFGYHLFENYFLVPAVYGNRLRLSALTVLVSCLAAVEIVGIVGAILALPVVACYPLVERIWLRPYLERDTVRRHQEMAKP